MKREIKFRGLRVDGKGWAYGMFMEMFNRIYILSPKLGGGAEQHHVDPKTIGQFTGLKDKNGKEIYEGDFIDGNEYSLTEHTTDSELFDFFNNNEANRTYSNRMKNLVMGVLEWEFESQVIEKL